MKLRIQLKQGFKVVFRAHFSIISSICFQIKLLTDYIVSADLTKIEAHVWEGLCLCRQRRR